MAADPRTGSVVFADGAAGLGERGRADDVQLAAGQRRLEHVARALGPLGAAGADDGVQLVDEDEHLVAVLADLVDELAHPLLEVTAVPGAGDQADSSQRDALMRRLKEAIRPECLNRIDEIVIFGQLETDQLAQITDLMLAETRQRLAPPA